MTVVQGHQPPYGIEKVSNRRLSRLGVTHGVAKNSRDTALPGYREQPGRSGIRACNGNGCSRSSM